MGAGSGRLNSSSWPRSRWQGQGGRGELLLCGGGSGYGVCDFLLKALVCEHKTTREMTLDSYCPLFRGFVNKLHLGRALG